MTSSFGTSAADYRVARELFAARKPFEGLEHLEASPRLATEARALAAKSIWYDYVGEVVASRSALTALTSLNRGLSRRVRYALAAAANDVGPEVDSGNLLASNQFAIVCLGARLMHDGTMPPRLVSRLNTALAVAAANPQAQLIVTGGNPRNTISEASAMRNWLIDNGITESRIQTEARARTTVENALYTKPILSELGLRDAVIVTTNDHLRRAVVNFRVARISVVGAAGADNMPNPADADAACAGGRYSQEVERIATYNDISRLLNL